MSEERPLVRFKPDRTDGKPRRCKATVRFTDDGMRLLERVALENDVCIGEVVRRAVAAAAALRAGPFKRRAKT